MNKFLTTLAAAAALAATASAQTINEIRIDQGGSDLDEYFELAGAPGMVLDGFTYIVIGDFPSGTVEAVVDLTGQVIPASGFFVAAEGTFTIGVADLTTTIDFENSDNVTHMLVQGFTGMKGDNVDPDGDGIMENVLWTNIVDWVSLEESDPAVSGDLLYSDTIVGPDGNFVPAHVFRTDVAGMNVWNIGDFGDLTIDTPGAANGNGFVSAANGKSQYYTLDAGLANAGGLYLVLSNVTGTAPGTPVDGLTLPLNFDSILAYSLTHASGAIWKGTLGFLDANGGAHAELALPALDPSTVGIQINTAAVVYDAFVTQAQFVTGAVPFDVLP
jgi:hypothetical protein